MEFLNTGGTLAAASLAVATGMLIRSAVSNWKDLFYVDPRKYLTELMQKRLSILLSKFKVTLVIEEFRGVTKSTIFEAVDIYLGETCRLKVGKNKNENMGEHQVITDLFEGASFSWSLVCQKVDKRDANSFLKSKVRSYRLTFHKKHCKLVLESYLHYIAKRAEEQKERDKVRKLYRNEFQEWHSTSIDLGHLMRFSTMTMSCKMKED